MLKARELDGWRGWKAGQWERYHAQGHTGTPWHREWMEWLEEDTAVWERKQKDREEMYHAQGHTGPLWQKEWMEWLEEDIAVGERKRTDREGEEGEEGAADARGQEQGPKQASRGWCSR